MEKKKAFEIIVGNIKKSDSEISGELDMQLLNMSEAARNVGYGCDPEELSTFFEREENLSGPFDRQTENRAAEAFRKQVRTAEFAGMKAFLCDLNSAYADKRPVSPDKKQEEQRQSESNPDAFPKNPVCKIAYMKNIHADEAFEAFCRLVSNPAASFATDFQSVCEEVYNGRADFCILPVETSEEGTLTAFRKLIDKYELITECVCAVQGDGQVTKYALLGRSPEVKIPVAGSIESCYVRVSFDSPDTESLLSLLSAASVLGATYVKSESMPLTRDDGRYNFCITFRLNREKIRAFLDYLELEFPDGTENTVYFQV